jgi:hypothetical protein
MGSEWIDSGNCFEKLVRFGNAYLRNTPDL